MSMLPPERAANSTVPSAGVSWSAQLRSFSVLSGPRLARHSSSGRT